MGTLQSASDLELPGLLCALDGGRPCSQGLALLGYTQEGSRLAGTLPEKHEDRPLDDHVYRRLFSLQSAHDQAQARLLADGQRPLGERLSWSEADGCPAVIFQYDWPTGEACRVAFCESRFDPDATNGANRGLFQLWTGWASYYDVPLVGLSDVRVNVELAYLIWRDHGKWSAWSCKP